MSEPLRQLLTDGLLTVAAVGAPLFAVMFLVGAVMGVVQAATQVNDSAVGFLPRLLAAVVVLVGLGGFMADRLASFLRMSLERMAGG